MKLTKLFNEFFNSEKSSGIILICCTIISLILANSNFSQEYIGLWEIKIGNHTLVHWINDGLMVIFFLYIGLELEREIYIGELSNIKEALFPIFGAIGGIIVPAGLYLALNWGTQYQDGAGIPMATDIAFALGVLSLLGKRVPPSLKVFLTALAVIDDLGAILVIAIFYTKELFLTNLFIAIGIFGILLIMNRMKIYNLIPYLIGGVLMWYFMLNSGVHATISGVLLAFAIPFGKGDEESISYKLEHFLGFPVAFFILPIFALANTAIPIASDWMVGLLEMNSIGIILGLIVGKPLGIFIVTFLSVKMKLCTMAQDIYWSYILGVGFLAGIGFTMSIFITLLAFDNIAIIDGSKIAILISSLIAALIGLFYLNMNLKKKIYE